MKVLVTGSNGQLGLSLKRLASDYPHIQWIFTDVEELDVTNETYLKVFIQKNGINTLINCAGYTAVDKAETEREKAYLVNDQAVKYLAKLSREFGFLLVHISTDYIFDGKKTSPYIESDNPNPQSIYGHSKYEGENEILSHAQRAVIIRTSWLYSEFGNNFVKTILRLAREKSEIKVVSDQTGTPTYATDLAGFILKSVINRSDVSGVNIYNYSNEGVATWYDFAKAIVDFYQLRCRVIPITTKEYPLPACRPAYSVLSKEKIKQEFNPLIPDWKESLKICLKNLMTDKSF
jgi:dTDP-4-dehydrorhamnose reductase